MQALIECQGSSSDFTQQRDQAAGQNATAHTRLMTEEGQESMQRKSEEALVKKVVLLEQELALAEIRASNAEKAKTKRAEDRSALADIKHALKGLKQDKTPPPPPGPTAAQVKAAAKQGSTEALLAHKFPSLGATGSVSESAVSDKLVAMAEKSQTDSMKQFKAVVSLAKGAQRASTTNVKYLSACLARKRRRSSSSESSSSSDSSDSSSSSSSSAASSASDQDNAQMEQSPSRKDRKRERERKRSAKKRKKSKKSKKYKKSEKRKSKKSKRK